MRSSLTFVSALWMAAIMTDSVYGVQLNSQQAADHFAQCDIDSCVDAIPPPPKEVKVDDPKIKKQSAPAVAKPVSAPTGGKTAPRTLVGKLEPKVY